MKQLDAKLDALKKDQQRVQKIQDAQVQDVVAKFGIYQVE